jgi:hypothetical protein
MSAGGALQAAIVAALSGVDGLAGAFDGPPARAHFPYATVDASAETDWSHKSGEGREVMIAVTMWDDQPARLNALTDLVEPAVSGVVTVAGWQLVTMQLARRRVVRKVAGPWAAAVDFRARMLAMA